MTPTTTRPDLIAIDSVAAESREQFCRRISISKATFYNLTRAGRIRVAKIGRRTVVPRSEILRIVAALDAGAAI